MRELTILAVVEVSFITDEIMTFTDETIPKMIRSTSTSLVALVLDQQEEDSNLLKLFS